MTEHETRLTPVIPLTTEVLRNLNTLHVEVVADFNPLISALNGHLTANLAPRQEGFHLTFINPQESWRLGHLTQEQLEELNGLNHQFRQGEIVNIAGIGLIDRQTPGLSVR